MKVTLQLFSITVFFFCYNATAQNFFQDMENDVFRCRFNAEGTFFDNENNTSPKFAFPKEINAGSMPVATLWISALNDTNGVAVANGSYYNRTDFQAGPIASQYVTTIGNNIPDSSYDYTYNRVWKISKAEIDYHINNYSQPNYIMPWVIDNWPANGNVLRGEAAQLAPFMDLNGNQKYEPLIGEYPVIAGDVAVYMIYNAERKDSASRDTRYYSPITNEKVPFIPMSLEIHAMAYAFNSENSDLLQSLFVNYKIYNRSNTTAYKDMYISQRTYFQLACFSAKTAIGSDTLLNYYYAYGLTDTDPCFPDISYNGWMPAFGVVFLSDSMKSFMYYDTNAGSKSGDPQIATDYNTYTRGMWKDSTAFGGSCDLFVSNPPTKYMFHDYPWDSSGYSEYTCNNFGGYRKSLGSTGPFNLAPQESLCIDVAFTFARDSSNTNSNFKSLDKLKLRVANLHSLYAQGVVGCSSILTSTNKQLSAEKQLRLFPNPASEEIKLEVLNQQATIKEVKIYDVAGRNISIQIPFENEQHHVKYLSVSHLPKGLYLLEATISNGNINRVKFVKQ